jgi:ATP-dependent DNA helicase RecG
MPQNVPDGFDSHPEFRQPCPGSMLQIVKPEVFNSGICQCRIETLLRFCKRLKQERRLSVAEAATAVQKDEAVTRAVLEHLVEIGLTEAHGIKKGRTYTLSARVYRALGDNAGYVRQAGFDPIQQEQMVLQYVKKHRKIIRKDPMGLCHLSEDQASRLLRRLQAEDKLKPEGKGRGAYYTATE